MLINLAKRYNAAKIGISIFQALTKSKLLDKQYDELTEKDRRAIIKSELKNWHIYCPNAGPNGEVIVGYVDDVIFDMVDDFVLQIKTFKIKNNFFKDNGLFTVTKETAIKGRRFKSKKQLFEYVQDQIKSHAIVLGSFHFTNIGILMHLLELSHEYFDNRTKPQNFQKIINSINNIIVDDLNSNKKTINFISPNVISALYELVMTAFFRQQTDLLPKEKYLILDFSTHAFSLLLGSKYREKDENFLN